MIEAKILYSPSGNLAEAYRRQVLTSASPWVLMVDHDTVLATNPHWYKLCESAILRTPSAGIFTCYTNVIGSPKLIVEGAPKGWDFAQHQRFAREHFEKHGFSVTPLGSYHKLSGFFMLLRKEAVAAAAFADGFFGVDWSLATAIVSAGYTAHRIDGLYVAHMRTRVRPFIEGEKTAISFNP